MLKLQVSKEDIIKKMIRKEINKIKPYIPGKPIKDVQEELGLTKIVKLASNENPLGVSNKVKEAVRREIININRYPDGANRSLKEVLSDKLGVTPEMLILGNGSDGLLKVLAESFLGHDDQVIISQPTFVEYLFVSHLMGSQLIRVYMNDYHQNLSAIADAVTGKTKMIFLTNPHNPAGTIFRKKEFEDFMQTIPEDIIVVVDEAYFEYVKAQDYPDSLKYVKAGHNIIVLRTFSKAYGLAGLRIGYAIAIPEIIEVLTRVREPFNVNHLAETAAIVALEDSKFLQRSIEVNEEGKRFLYKELEKRDIDYVLTEANFILVNIKRNSGEMSQKLMEEGVIVRSGERLGYPGHLRVTVGTIEECNFFIDCIDKLVVE